MRRITTPVVMLAVLVGCVMAFVAFNADTATAKTKRGMIGETLRLRGSFALVVDVTPTRVVHIPPALDENGHEVESALLGIRYTIKNVGREYKTAYRDCFLRDCAYCLPGGSPVKKAVDVNGDPLPGQRNKIILPYSRTRAVWVYFEPTFPDEAFERWLFQPCSGYGFDIGVWQA